VWIVRTAGIPSEEHTSFRVSLGMRSHILGQRVGVQAWPARLPRFVVRARSPSFASLGHYIPPIRVVAHRSAS
jgi:hypothetical protein